MRRLRFGVEGTTGGRSLSYKLLSQGEHFYLLCRNLGDGIKLSLHPTLWKVEVSRAEPEGRPSRSTWAGSSPDEDGKVLVGRILVTRAALDDRTPRRDSVTWVPMAEDAGAIEFRFYLAPVHDVALVDERMRPVGVVRSRGQDRQIVVLAVPRAAPAPQTATFDNAALVKRILSEDGPVRTMAWSTTDNQFRIVDSYLIAPQEMLP